MTGRPLGAWFLDWQRSCLLSSGTSRGDAVTVEVAAGGRKEDAGDGRRVGVSRTGAVEREHPTKV